MAFRRLVSPLREFGIGSGIAYLVSRLCLALPGQFRLYTYDFMVQPITDRRLIPERRARNIAIREIHRGDPVCEAMATPLEIIEDRFAHGARCYAAYLKDDLMGYAWLSTAHHDEDEIRCRYVLEPRAASVFDFDVYVEPRYRIGLGFIGLWDGLNRLLCEQGVRYSFSRVTRFNVASRRAHDHLGWVRLGGAITFKAWNVELMFATLAPFVSLSMRRRPRMTLSADEVAFAAEVGD